MREKFRVTVEVNNPKFIPDARSDTSRGHYISNWSTDTIVEGDRDVVAATLRALADKLDPKRPTLRGIEKEA